jgi:hypothetical protein
LRGQLICNNEKDIGFGHDEISASVLDPWLPADIVGNNGQALPLFADLFGLCPTRDRKARGMAGISAGPGAGFALPSLGWGWL